MKGMTIKAGDFVKIDFTGYDDKTVFDTTIQQVADEHGLTNKEYVFEPVVVCVGQGHLLPGLDTAIQGKPSQGTFSATITAGDAFGKKRADLLKLMPLKLFSKQEIKPFPGLEMDIDGMRGTVKSVSGNRVIMDFNHPLSGKDLRYEVTVHEKILDTKEQLLALVGRTLRFTPEIIVEEQKATIKTPIKLPTTIQEELTKHIKDLTVIEEVSYEVSKKDKA